MKNKQTDIHAIVEQLMRRKAVGMELYLQDGELLSMAIESKSYRELGEHVKTDSDFFREVGISRSDAMNKVRVWRKFGQALKAQENGPIEVTRLVSMLPIQMSEEEVTDWLHQAAALLPTEFRDAVRERRGMVTSTDCTHEETETHSRCRGCGKWLS